MRLTSTCITTNAYLHVHQDIIQIVAMYANNALQLARLVLAQQYARVVIPLHLCHICQVAGVYQHVILVIVQSIMFVPRALQIQWLQLQLQQAQLQLAQLGPH